MTPAQAKKLCLSLPAATHDVKWGADHVYSVGGKMFAVIGPDGSMSFKVDDHRFLELTDREGFIPAPYMARAKWVQVKDVKAVAEAELKPLVTRSHQLVALKLTRKMRESLGLAD